MLHIETVTSETLELIKELQQLDFLNHFYLVGGTALALQIGHRTSTDIDLFSNESFDMHEINNEIQLRYKPTVLSEKKIGVFTYLKNIKTDIVYHPFKYIDNPIEIEGIKMLTSKEIAAMKLNAITRRGKKRDFIDLCKLLERYELAEMIELYIKKYEIDSTYYLITSLTYFEDAEKDEDPKCFFNYNWRKIKNTIIKEVKNL